MEEKTISFETAKLAKEKGFSLKVFYFYLNTNILQDANTYERPFYNGNPDIEFYFRNWNEESKNRCSAPTQSLLQKWLREEHEIHIILEISNVYTDDNNLYGYKLYKITNDGFKCINIKELNKTYEETLEKGLYEALKLIK